MLIIISKLAQRLYRDPSEDPAPHADRAWRSKTDENLRHFFHGTPNQEMNDFFGVKSKSPAAPQQTEGWISAATLRLNKIGPDQTDEQYDFEPGNFITLQHQLDTSHYVNIYAKRPNDWLPSGTSAKWTYNPKDNTIFIPEGTLFNGTPIEEGEVVLISYSIAPQKQSDISSADWVTKPRGPVSKVVQQTFQFSGGDKIPLKYRPDTSLRANLFWVDSSNLTSLTNIQSKCWSVDFSTNTLQLAYALLTDNGARVSHGETIRFNYHML